jgi:hypothetical protein
MMMEVLVKHGHAHGREVGELSVVRASGDW